MTGRPRTSTVVLGATFLLTLMLYLWVRPAPPPPTQLVPVVRVPVTTVAPRDTTSTTRPRQGPTTTEVTMSPASVPPETSTTTASAASSTTTTTVRTGITLVPGTTSTTQR